MKTLSIIVMFTASIFTEAFFHAGHKGWLLYTALVLLATACFCWPHGKHERRRFK